MKRFTVQLCIALIAGAGLLATTLPAEARDGRHWQYDHRAYSPGWSQHRPGPPPHVVHKRHGKQKVEVHHHYYQPHHYGRPAPARYAPPRYVPPRHAQHRHSTVTHRHVSSSPAIVISMPPIVIPVR